MAQKPKVGLSIEAKWLDDRPHSDGSSPSLPELDVSLCKLKIRVGDDVATRFRTDNGTHGDAVTIPAYHLAEWISENWWPLLFEPLKTDSDSLDPDFRNRHWVGAARNGFALPDLWLLSVGEEETIEVTETRLETCRLNFEGGDFERILEKAQTKAALKSFVSSVATRLNGSGVKGTDLQTNWQQILRTTQEEEEFCGLIGALGLSPYETHPAIEQALDEAFDLFGYKITKDICETADQHTFLNLCNLVRDAFGAMETAPPVDLSAVAIERPSDTRKDLKAAKWGTSAALKLRAAMGVQSADRESSNELFRRIEIDPARMPILGRSSDEVEGAFKREHDQMRIIFTTRAQVHRPFAAARAFFLGWGAERQDARLITRASTREQQASRAFAAEIVAPIDFIRKAAGRGPISKFRIGAIADELGVSSKVVLYQAFHHNLPVVDPNWASI